MVTRILRQIKTQVPRALVFNSACGVRSPTLTFPAPVLGPHGGQKSGGGPARGREQVEEPREAWRWDHIWSRLPASST